MMSNLDHLSASVVDIDLERVELIKKYERYLMSATRSRRFAGSVQYIDVSTEQKTLYN